MFWVAVGFSPQEGNEARERGVDNEREANTYIVIVSLRALTLNWDVFFLRVT